MNKTIIAGLLSIGVLLVPSVAFAEEVVEDSGQESVAPAAEPAPEPELAPEPAPEPEPAPAPSYTPPPEAYEGVGGWAVVDPSTGKVHGVVVCNAAACGPEGNQGGVTTHSYMGCPAGCVYRFQSRAQASGNVVGIHSDGLNSVTWDGDSEGTFSVNQGGASSSSSSTLVPSRTMADGERMDTGFVNTRSRATTEQNVRIDQFKEDYEDTDVETDILFPEWGVEGKLFRYLSQQDAESSLGSDVDNSLLAEGFSTEKTTSTTSVDEETGEETTTETTETVVDEDNVFVKTVREWTQSVIDFFHGIFG
jgi:hypothetical protein